MQHNRSGLSSLVTFIFLVISLPVCSQPVISSFSPASGPVGTSVQINGTGFNAVAANNTVYFGAVKATVLSASISQLSVTVPGGTSYENISVTANGLTGWSRVPFTVSFAGAGNAFTQNSFDTGAFTATNTSYPLSLTNADFNGDGRPDLVLSVFLNGLKILKNASLGSSIAFSNAITIPTGEFTNNLPAIADFDGDGKYDIAAATNFGNDSVTVFKNTGNGGNIAFNTATRFSTLNINNEKLIAADLNTDGKPDIILLNNTGSTRGISVFKNTSNSGNTSFAAQQDFLFEQSAFITDLAKSDIDGDGRIDLVVAVSADSVVVLRNTGSAGNFSFAAPARFACPLQPRLSIADMDSDGKPDLVLLGDPGIDQFGILRNTSNPGSVSLAGPVNYNTGTMSTSIPVSDLDGDGKIDVAVCNNGDQQTGLFKNNSTGSLISLQPAFLYTAAVEPAAINLGDLDSDGKPDIIISNAELNQSVSIYRNTTGEPVRLNLCPPVAGTTFSSDQPGLSWQWQLNTGTGFVTINDNSNYSGTNTANLALVNIPDNWYGYQYRCLVNGTVYSSVFTLRFVNKWTGAESTAWENPLNWSCGVLPDANTDVEINEGTVILNSNKSCRTILVRPGAVFTVNSPFGLTVTY